MGKWLIGQGSLMLILGVYQHDRLSFSGVRYAMRWEY